jgi:hypothetical protein
VPREIDRKSSSSQNVVDAKAEGIGEGELTEAFNDPDVDSLYRTIFHAGWSE